MITDKSQEIGDDVAISAEASRASNQGLIKDLEDYRLHRVERGNCTHRHQLSTESHSSAGLSPWVRPLKSRTRARSPRPAPNPCNPEKHERSHVSPPLHQTVHSSDVLERAIRTSFSADATATKSKLTHNKSNNCRIVCAGQKVPQQRAVFGRININKTILN